MNQYLIEIYSPDECICSVFNGYSSQDAWDHAHDLLQNAQVKNADAFANVYRIARLEQC